MKAAVIGIAGTELTPEEATAIKAYPPAGIILFGRKFKLPDLLASQSWIARLHNAKTGIPYGIALALGGLAVYPETQFWTLLAVN